MPRVQIEVDLAYEVQSACSFLFQVAVAGGGPQRILDESLSLNDGPPPGEIAIPPGGLRGHRLRAEPGELRLAYRAEVQTEPARMAAPIPPAAFVDVDPAAIPFTYPSRYCESNRLMNAAADRFGSVPPAEVPAAVCDWIHATLAYTPGSTNADTTAADVFLSRRGVCRDYAHLATTLCRALGIPARYVAGYLVDLQPPDFHAVTEVFLGGRWWLFDATRLAPLEGFVRIGAGRDAADISFATFDGPAQLQDMRVTAAFADGTQTDPSDLTPLSLCPE